MIKKGLLVLFLGFSLSVFPNITSSPNYFFSKIDSDKGLSHNEVKSIIQDSWGFMWFGTRNRLNRYDGRAIKIFNCYDSLARKTNNSISALFEDESRNLWVGTDIGIFLFDPIIERFSYFSLKSQDGISMVDWVSEIKSDGDGNIWIVIPNQGVFEYKPNLRTLQFFSFGTKELPDQGSAECICISKYGKVWIGTNGDGVYLFDKEANEFIRYLGDANNNTLKGKNIFTMCDYGDFLIVGVHEGKLLKFNKRKNILLEMMSPEIDYKIIRDVECLNNNQIWVGTQSGLYIVDELKNQVLHFTEDITNPHALSANIVGVVYQDREGGVWLGTFFDGVNYIPNLGMKFENYILPFKGNTMASRRVRDISEDGNGNIWVGTEDGLLNVLDPATNEFKPVKLSYNYEQNNRIMSVFIQDKTAWVGYFKNGIDLVSLADYSVKHYSGEDLGLDESSVYAIYQDRNNNMWLGNGWGVFVAPGNQMSFKRMNNFGLCYVHDITEDAGGNIWVSTIGKGVFRFNPANGKTDHFVHSIDDTTSISSNSVSSITETSKGEIWFSTDRGGISRYNAQTNTFTSYSTNNGFPDDVAYKIVEDRNQDLWFGTNKGLVKFNPNTLRVKVYTSDNGLLGNQFNYKSAIMSHSGKLYFGGLNGMVAFDPGLSVENQYIPPVYITRFAVFNHEPVILAENSPLSKSIIHTSEITLKHFNSNITLDFASLSLTSPLSNQYAYKLEDVDKDWIYASDHNSVSYANLTPGKYTFRVKGSNNDGLWNPQETILKIRILPPWWMSVYSYVFYYFVLLGIIFFLVTNYKKRHEQKSLEKQKLYEAEKEKELYSIKVDFFTSIAHEIRTPLTLINGPLESLKEMNIKDVSIQKNLQIMENNTKQLLLLINELLDFRKMDNKKVMLRYSLQNINQLLQATKSEFEILARQQNKTIGLQLPETTIEAAVDYNELMKVLNNLLANAVKYSEKQIQIELSNKPGSFTIIISNDGTLIREIDQPKIFDPFYQVEKDRNNPSSTGIGLSLARSIAELHHGTLHFEIQNNMNAFVLKLPINQPDTEVSYIPKDAESTFIIEEINGDLTDKSKKPILLIIEDNVEMLSFTSDKLKSTYTVEKATNGLEALKIMDEKYIDIILSDVMMPQMDGFEFCRQVKNNIEYSHIPIVLLTAKNDLDSKIKGLSAGADAYIEKPFSFGYLQTQLSTLLSNRQREKDAFLKKPFLTIEQMGMNKADEKFMEKIVAIINENITDSDFNVEKLSEIVFMSRSNLYRKIKALTELTPVDFIRLIRLKKAAVLIKEGHYRIGEVCYLVGINSSSYFIKLFQKQFGMTPKEFEKQERN